jgi:hypothetical protein
LVFVGEKLPEQRTEVPKNSSGFADWFASRMVRYKKQSVRCGCKAAIQLYEHMVTGVTIMNKVELQHKYPCQPGVHQLLRGRRKAGVNPSSIPVEIVKDMANIE